MSVGADERSESETNKQIHSGSREGGTYVPGEVLRAVVVAGLAAHGDELVVDAGLLERQQLAHPVVRRAARPEAEEAPDGHSLAKAIKDLVGGASQPHIRAFLR